MKIVVFGAGGVGGYFGARLAEAGNDVTFIARGAHKAAMEKNGLAVKSDVGDLLVQPVNVTEDIAAVEEAEIVLFCAKMWDTEAAARAMAPFLKDEALVISLQNGVEAEDILDEILGPKHVAGGLCHISAFIDRPGLIQHVGALARLTVGVRAPGQEPQLAKFAFACHRADFDLNLTPDVEAAIWRKFVFLSALAGACCYFRAAIEGFRDHEERRAFFADLVGEAAAVGRARGVNLDETLEEATLGFLDELPGAMKASMLLDLERGNRLELEWLTGAVCRLGDELNIETPRSREVYEALKDHAG
jgi:2-dehydropantoate 2-reductase